MIFSHNFLYKTGGSTKHFTLNGILNFISIYLAVSVSEGYSIFIFRDTICKEVKFLVVNSEVVHIKVVWLILPNDSYFSHLMSTERATTKTLSFKVLALKVDPT